MSKKIKMIIVLIFLLISMPIITQATVYVESKPGTVPWVKITVSNSYQVCQDMSDANSSIGNSNNLKPHLTTNKDWNAVALLSASAYGLGTPSDTGTTIRITDEGKYGDSSNRPYYSTTGNLSGIMNMGNDPYLSTLKSQYGIEAVYSQTASLLKESKNIANNYRTNLVNNSTPYVEEVISGYTEYSTSIREIINGAAGRDAEGNRGMGIWTTETLVGSGVWADWRRMAFRISIDS